MKPELAIVCVEDEIEVLESVVRDLELYEDDFLIETATSVTEAHAVLNHLLSAGNRVALFICDHLMPGQTGVEFLVHLNGTQEFKDSEKMLLTGQAGLQDTVKAVNEAGLDYYIAKPWQRDHLQRVVRTLLTDYVIKSEKNLLRYFSCLDAERISEAVRKNTTLTDT